MSNVVTSNNKEDSSNPASGVCMFPSIFYVFLPQCKYRLIRLISVNVSMCRNMFASYGPVCPHAVHVCWALCVDCMPLLWRMTKEATVSA